ncbi:MAG: hypothetical protein R3C02_15020 [Planctomycetaceae bacterium]
MTSSRPYRNGMSEDQATKILQDGAGTQWDADIVKAFLDLPPEKRRNAVAKGHASRITSDRQLPPMFSDEIESLLKEVATEFAI